MICCVEQDLERLPWPVDRTRERLRREAELNYESIAERRARREREIERRIKEGELQGDVDLEILQHMERKALKRRNHLLLELYHWLRTDEIELLWCVDRGASRSLFPLYFRALAGADTRSRRRLKHTKPLSMSCQRRLEAADLAKDGQLRHFEGEKIGFLYVTELREYAGQPAGRGPIPARAWLVLAAMRHNQGQAAARMEKMGIPAEWVEGCEKCLVRKGWATEPGKGGILRPGKRPVLGASFCGAEVWSMVDKAKMGRKGLARVAVNARARRREGGAEGVE